MDGTDVNTVCRANNRRVMATGDDFQKVNLFRYPSVMPKSGCKRYTGHSSHVTRVRFMVNDNILVSVGGNDKTALVWTTDFGGESPMKAQIFGESLMKQNEPDVDDILGFVPKVEKVGAGDQMLPPTPTQNQTLGDSPF